MKNTLIIILLLVFTGCIKEKQSVTNINWKNQTNQSIVVMPFKYSRVDSSNIITLLSNEQVQIEENLTRGETSTPIHFNNYFKNVDSIWIIWNDTFKVTHLISGDYSSIGKFISFNDTNRNIGFVSGYNYMYKKLKGTTNHSLTYYFTEADYEYAKE